MVKIEMDRESLSYAKVMKAVLTYAILADVRKWGIFCVSWVFRTVPLMQILHKLISFKSQKPGNVGNLSAGV